MRTPRLALAAALSLTVLGGCATSRTSFTGTVAPPGEARFAGDATVQVLLVDEASGSVVATQSFPVDGRHEAVPFRLTPSEALPAGGRYALRARVLSRTGAVLYESAQATPVTLPASGALAVTVQPLAGGGAVVGAAR